MDDSQTSITEILLDALLSALPDKTDSRRLYWIKPVPPRVARFFLVNYTKPGKNVPNGHKLCIPNVCKIFQLAIKYSNSFQSEALQNLPKLGFLV
jgi:hypothetical protein